MRLKVEELKKPIPAKTFGQKFAGITSEFPIGSSNYANCAGLCIWNHMADVGILAHIEAPEANYPDVFENVCKILLEKINAKTDSKGSFSIVIFGAAATDTWSALFEKSLFDHFGKNFRLNTLEVMDMRNSKARGKIGRVKPIDEGGYGAAVLDPSTGTLYLSPTGKSILEKDSKTVEIFAIQK